MARKAPVRARPLLPPRVGLIPTADVLQEATDRWEAGFGWQPEGCGSSGRFDPCGPGGVLFEADPVASLEYVPFGVVAGEVCSTFGWEEREWQARAQRLLDACESQQVEAELWRGDIARAGGYPNAFLASADAEVIGNTQHDPMDALALLEGGIAGCVCNGNGWIHASRTVTSIWSRTGALRREGKLLLTALDTVVVPGAGYDGSGPIVTIDAPANLQVVADADGALADGDYGYKITAYNDSGESGPSAEVQVAIAAPNSTAHLTWDVAPTASGYRVYGRAAGGPWGLLVTIGDPFAVEWEDTGVAALGAPPPPAEGAFQPVPATDGSVWAFATGPIDVRRGAVEVLPRSLEDARELAAAVARDVNDIRIWAQRHAAATFDGCCHIGIEIDAPVEAIA